MKYLLILLGCLCLFSCGSPSESETTTPLAGSPAPDQKSRSLSPEVNTKATMADQGEMVVNALKAKDLETLAKIIHPLKGIRFSPEVTVSKDQRVFSAEEVEGLMNNSDAIFWGLQDGTGDSIKQTFSEYYERYIYDVDFANADSIFINHDHQWGNAINNARQAYSKCQIVEYYFPGIDPAYMGMDWRGLRLVFEEHQNSWYLVGLIHTGWTS